MKYTIKIEVDANDADYLINTSTITAKQLEQLRPMFAAIKRFIPYKGSKEGMYFTHDSNFPYGECCREDLGELPAAELYSDIDPETFELFMELCPNSEFGFHTVESVEIAPEVKWEKLV